MVLSAGLLALSGETRTSCTAVADSKASSAREKIGEAAEATVAVPTARRDECAGATQKRLDELDAKYQALEKRAAEEKGNSKKDLDEKVKVAKARRDAAAKKLDELKAASHDRREKIKDGVDNALKDLKKAFE